MFAWNDQDQVGDIIWDELSETEDHIVPYPKGTDECTLLNFGDYNNKQKVEEASTVLRSTDQTAVAKNDFVSCNLENASTFKTDEELSALRLDIDSWPEMPYSSAAFGKEYNDENGQDTLTTELMNNFEGSTDLYKARGITTGGTVQLDGKSEMVGNNNNEDKENDNFLDCYWANIGDFNDLDRTFSDNDSIFGHEMVGNGGEFLSSSSDVICGAAQSILVPDMPLSREQPSDHRSSSFHFDDLSGGNRKSEEEIADNAMKTEEQAEYKTNVTSHYCGTHNQYPNKDDHQKTLLRSHKKVEDKNKTQPNLYSAWSHNVCQSQQSPNPNIHTFVETPLQTFQCPAAIQQRQVGGSGNMGYLGPSDPFLFSGYEYSPCHFPAFALLPHIHSQRNQMKPVGVNCKLFPDSSKHSNSLGKPPDIPSRPLKMTPQEKIEKLRRRQQMHAVIAIQQQQQHLGHHIAGNDSLAPTRGSLKKQGQESITNSTAVDDSADKLSASNMSMLVDQDESHRILTSIDDQLLEESIYYELQGVLRKLDIQVRYCIRDSLFRLAQNATERQSAGDRSSTNKSNKDEDEVPANQAINRQHRCKNLPGAETNTNPIDRSVAHLLFHKRSESCMRPVKDEILQSPISFNPD